MTRKLFDLAAADEARRFSPYCWRSKLALAHKGLLVETVAWRFTDGDTIAFSGQGRVPVLVDGERVVSDSWEIALYLEQTYPDRPPLFNGVPAATKFVNSWADGVLHPAISPLILTDILAHIAERDRAYFRTSREARFGKTLEEVCADRDGRVFDFRKLLEPVRTMLTAQPYFGGAAASYADYIVFGSLQWARCISPFPLLTADDPVATWRDRILDMFDGLARKAPAYDLAA